MSLPGCCHVEHGCIFAKVVLAREAGCECARRRSIGEQLALDCNLPAARGDCATLAALLHERARFVLKLPARGPMTHQQALRLHCGGVAALARHLQPQAEGAASPPLPDLQQLVREAQQRHADLGELPWASLVPAIAAWQPRRRRPVPR